jgi:hypothetical protein
MMAITSDTVKASVQLMTNIAVTEPRENVSIRSIVTDVVSFDFRWSTSARVNVIRVAAPAG